MVLANGAAVRRLHPVAFAFKQTLPVETGDGLLGST